MIPWMACPGGRTALVDTFAAMQVMLEVQCALLTALPASRYASRSLLQHWDVTNKAQLGCNGKPGTC